MFITYQDSWYFIDLIIRIVFFLKPPYGQHSAHLYVCDKWVPILFHDSITWVLSISWVHVYTMSPCLYHRSMSITGVLVSSMHQRLYHESLAIIWVIVYNMSQKFKLQKIHQITGKLFLEIQTYNLQEYRNTNYKVHKYRNTNDRNIEIQITEIQITEVPKYQLKRYRNKKIQKNKLQTYQNISYILY